MFGPDAVRRRGIAQNSISNLFVVILYIAPVTDIDLLCAHLSHAWTSRIGHDIGWSAGKLLRKLFLMIDKNGHRKRLLKACRMVERAAAMVMTAKRLATP